ncbi:hypothetical protein F442_05067 [Phytophthora nicotianae P10297]|uniref:Uncharacterized protein n=1 Tax=Phytophthora nicotianae P10297 TaxID=1317064 RepID=W2ZQT3_PHYNI|nr:hypothetical protein F442_05067 [Phytophthora nicotianae P10297]
MIDVEGDAVFGSFPNERFRFGVEHANGIGEIWLESQASKKRWWGCEVTDVAAFTPADVALPPKDSASLCGGQFEGIRFQSCKPPTETFSQNPLPAEVQAEQITLLTAPVQELSNKK